MFNSATLRTAIAAAAVVAVYGSSAAVAQQPESSGTRFFQGLYLSGAIGAHSTQNADVSGGSVSADVDTDRAVAGLVGLGLQLGTTHWRVEMEGGYRPSDVDSISGVSGTGDVDAYTFMGNVFYDIELAKKLNFYLGGGLGLADVDIGSASSFGGSTINTDDLGWAWQLGAGAAYGLSDRLKLTLDYRFLNIEDLDYETSPSVGSELDWDYRDHAIFVGLRYYLNPPAKPMMAAPAPAPAPVAQAPKAAPPPPPPPPPMPEPTRNFLVFFDWDKSDITAEAAAILREAAATAKKIGPVRIIATGHADRSGPAKYNMGLSDRRAQAVKAALQNLGIDPATIATFARGETDPLVATPDGVREPQNRRVEIVIQ